ncbi:MAG: hypothetical protein ABSG68_13660 [Thermoguttaceae bacterium]
MPDKQFPTGRLLFDAPAGGAWNMAVDEVLLDWAAAEEECGLRFYGWSEPTLSLGYFQPYEDRRRHPASLACPAVRRLTGGGAIVHDAELTYSVVLCKTHPLARERNKLYEMMHGTLLEALAEVGVCARMYREAGACLDVCGKSGGSTVKGDSPIFAAIASDRHTKIGTVPATIATRTAEPVLCFQRRAQDDVLVGDIKVAGSAQRRRRGDVLQHGSVLLRRSPAAPELPGLADLAPQMPSAEALAALWLRRLDGQLASRWTAGGFSAEETLLAKGLVEHRYGDFRSNE